MYQKIGQILIVIGLILLAYWALHTFLRNRVLQIAATENPAQVTLAPVKIAFANHAAFSLRSAVEVNGHWNVWPDSVTYIPSSGNNLIIYAHNTKPLFGDLKKINIGESVAVTMQDGTQKTFVITGRLIVGPSETALLQPTTNQVLTLYTCIGFLDSQRLVLRANLK